MELNVYRFTDFGFSLQFRTESWHSSVWFYRCQKLPTNGRTEEVSNGENHRRSLVLAFGGGGYGERGSASL